MTRLAQIYRKIGTLWASLINAWRLGEALPVWVVHAYEERKALVEENLRLQDEVGHLHRMVEYYASHLEEVMDSYRAESNKLAIYRQHETQLAALIAEYSAMIQVLKDRHGL